MKKAGAILIAMVVLGLGMGVWFSSKGDGKKVETTKQPIAVQKPTIRTTSSEIVITITAVGDVMLGRTVRQQMLDKQDWNWPLEKTADRLKQADLTIGNLEAPFVAGCSQNENRMTFCTNPEAMSGLKLAGFDMWTLANNHMLNYGPEGVTETRKFLADNGMRGSYNGELVTREIKGSKIGLMGWDDTVKSLDLTLLADIVASAAADTDILITMVHWGNEYTASPSARQREVAQVLASSGADMVIGSHPHWVQGVERSGKTLIFWSLGNFVFDQMWSEETRQGAMAEIRFKTQNSKLSEIDYEMVPVRIYDYGQPRFE